MTRAAYLTNFLPPYHLPLLRALQARVSELRVYVSTSMEPNRPWQAEWGGIQVSQQHTFTLKCTWKHPRGFVETSYLHMPYDTIFRLIRYQPNIVITAEMGLRTIQATIYRCLQSESRLIIWARLSEETELARGRLRLAVRRWLLRKADLVLVNGRSGANYIQRFGIADNKIFLAPYVIDMEPFMAVEPIDPSREMMRHMLYVGQLIERKGLIPFLQVLFRWARDNPSRNLELSFAGDGPLRPILEAMVPPMNLAFHFLGNIPYPSLPDVYSSADVVAFPTLADEWGVVVNESLAASRPVLGSKNSQAVQELIEDEVNGWTFSPEKAGEVYDSLDRALQTSPKDLAMMGQAGKLRVARVTPEILADEIMKAIESCLH